MVSAAKAGPANLFAGSAYEGKWHKSIIGKNAGSSPSGRRVGGLVARSRRKEHVATFAKELLKNSERNGIIPGRYL